MANMCDKLEIEILDGVTGITSLFSSSMSLALFSADPTDTGSVTNELSGDNYARKLLSGLFTAATGTTGVSANTSIITFPTATADWSDVTHVGFMESDVETTDDMIAWVALGSTVSTLDTQVFTFEVGTLTVTAK